MYFYVKLPSGGKETFNERQMAAANKLAQQLANETGKPVARHDSYGGQSLFYPQKGKQKNPSTVSAQSVLKAGKSILARVKRVGNKLHIEPVVRSVKRTVKRAAKSVRRNPVTAGNKSEMINGLADALGVTYRSALHVWNTAGKKIPASKRAELISGGYGAGSAAAAALRKVVTIRRES